MLTVDNENVSHDAYYVKSGDTDLYHLATIPYCFSLMQEMGGGHAAAMGVGIEDLFQKYKYTWVISRTKVNFCRYAMWRETVSLESWAQSNVRLSCPRVINGYVGDKPYFSAMTLWAVVDVARKRPVRPQQVLDELNLADPAKHFVSPDLGPMAEWDETEKLELLPPYEAVPQFYDLDINGHINNVVYVEWIISSLPRTFLKDHEAAMLDVKWVKQTYADDDLTAESAVTGKNGDSVSFIHRIRNKDGATVFSAVSSWRKRTDEKDQPIVEEL